MTRPCFPSELLRLTPLPAVLEVATMEVTRRDAAALYSAHWEIQSPRAEGHAKYLWDLMRRVQEALGQEISSPFCDIP